MIIQSWRYWRMWDALHHAGTVIEMLQAECDIQAARIRELEDTNRKLVSACRKTDEVRVKLYSELNKK